MNNHTQRMKAYIFARISNCSDKEARKRSKLGHAPGRRGLALLKRVQTCLEDLRYMREHDVDVDATIEVYKQQCQALEDRIKSDKLKLAQVKKTLKAFGIAIEYQEMWAAKSQKR